MKKILFVVFCLTISVNTWGQAKEITEKEYNSVESIVTSKFEKNPYTEFTTIEDFENGKLVRTETVTEENLPPDKLKWTSVEKSEDETTKSELITIGNTQYKRENNGKWTKETWEEDEPISAESGEIVTMVKEIPNRKKYSMEESKLDDQPVRIYTVITVYDDSPEVTHTFRRWINSENLALQTEELETDTKTGLVISRTVSKNKYNPKDLKIEAPIK